MKPVWVFILFATVAAQAAPIDRFELKSADLVKSQDNTDNAELILAFQDRQPVSGVCDLILKRFEFVDSLQSLIIDFKPANFCPREDIGKRQGVVRWQLPSHLFNAANLRIVVNDRPLSDLKIVKGSIIIKTKP